MGCAILVIGLLISFISIFNILEGRSHFASRIRADELFMFVAPFYIATIPALLYLEMKKYRKLSYYALWGMISPIVGFIFLMAILYIASIAMDIFKPVPVVDVDNLNGFKALTDRGVDTRSAISFLVIYEVILGCIYTSLYWLFAVKEKKKTSNLPHGK